MIYIRNTFMTICYGGVFEKFSTLNNYKRTGFVLGSVRIRNLRLY